MAIHWSLPHLKTLLPPELHARLPEAYCDPFGGSIEKTTIYNSASGEVLKEIVMPGMIRVDRNRMRALCSEGLDIYYSKALSGLQYGNSGKGITASFADGTSMVGDMVVGADGPHSAVRTELLGKEVAAAKSSNLVSFMSTVNYKDAEKARHVRSGNPIFCMAYNPAGIMNFISGKLTLLSINSTSDSTLLTILSVQNVLDPEDPTTWSFSISSSWVGQLDPTLDNAGRLAALKQKIGDNCGEPFKSAIEWIPDDDTTTIMGRISYWVTEPWDNHGGRVTLAGDAAHPMTPCKNPSKLTRFHQTLT
jgi:2-polyprenyl-6-methoxyphenol hydroxylase-like FAD-dependent oxidoreductase